MRVLVIGLTLALASGSLALDIRTVPKTGFTKRHIALMMKAPESMTPRELGAWNVLCQGLAGGTQEFTEEVVRNSLSESGPAPKLWWSDELCVLYTELPAGGTTFAPRALASIVQRPDLTDEKLDSSRAILKQPKPDDWVAALSGASGDLDVRNDFIREFSKRVFRREQISFSVTAGLEGPMAGAFDDWKTVATRPDNRIGTSPRFIGPENAKTLLLEGSAIVPSTSTSPEMLAMIAFGAGKTSSLFRVWRERELWSYRQEAILWPGAKGWKPRFIAAGASEFPETAAMITALERDVDAWTEQDRARLVVMAEQCLNGNMPLSPFWLDGSGPLAPGEEDRFRLAAYLRFLGAPLLNPDAMIQDIRRVSLEELKLAGRGILASLRNGIAVRR